MNSKRTAFYAVGDTCPDTYLMSMGQDGPKKFKLEP